MKGWRVVLASVGFGGEVVILQGTTADTNRLGNYCSHLGRKGPALGEPCRGQLITQAEIYDLSFLVS